MAFLSVPSPGKWILDIFEKNIFRPFFDPGRSATAQLPEAPDCLDLPHLPEAQDCLDLPSPAAKSPGLPRLCLHLPSPAARNPGLPRLA